MGVRRTGGATSVSGVRGQRGASGALLSENTRRLLHRAEALVCVVEKETRRGSDAKLVELALYAKELCPDGRVEMSTRQYEDEDGSVDVFPPPTLSEDEEDRLELALAARAGEIFDATGLFILCGLWAWKS